MTVPNQRFLARNGLAEVMGKSWPTSRLGQATYKGFRNSGVTNSMGYCISLS